MPLPIEVLQITAAFLNTLALLAAMASTELPIINRWTQPRSHIRVPLTNLHTFE